MGTSLKFQFPLVSTFFGLTPQYRTILFSQIHDLVYHGGGGFIHSEVYNMPIWMRLFHISRINEHNKKNDYKYYQNKQSWNTNVISWVDENVLSSYKGNIINYDELRKNTEETLTNIIFHLKQSGLIIDVNYEIISSYVKENPFLEEEFDQVSNNDKKKLSSNLDQSLIEKFNFTI